MIAVLLEGPIWHSGCSNAVQDMDKRKRLKQMELLWRGSESFGSDADVFTGNFPAGVTVSVASVALLATCRRRRCSICGSDKDVVDVAPNHVAFCSMDRTCKDVAEVLT